MIEFNDIKILSWNIRGAHNAGSKRHIKSLINRFSPSFLVIMETHVQFARTKVFGDQCRYTAVASMEARGHSGGLWVLMQ